jgi:hypothetical protein
MQEGLNLNLVLNGATPVGVAGPALRKACGRAPGSGFRRRKINAKLGFQK